MKNTFLGLTAIAVLSISCKKDEKATYIKEAGSMSEIALNAPKVSLMDQAGIQSNPNPAPIANAPGMNPPHGQPGHRCDIPVGQPLSSSPAPASQNITVNGNNTIQIDPNSGSPGKIPIDHNENQVKTAPGMNPPHGQPGHRCDIPVGQPLNSKPAAAPQQNIIQTPPAPAPAEQKLAMGDKPQINPAHGEPWHNCAVKVGDPLP
ncbi:MAG: hypothetical protein MUW56_11530 [Chryseobacterium sp.]|uniref:hypothetical protein n=1 Tax=Chryseobacterium sp. TaxID=1871047 RepID=UPI0025C1507E|nr:hypothetical protein [Chryseobacterium sp.]MCJ7934238.1 hypothetical protein [Chryseobacterium sp.]